MTEHLNIPESMKSLTDIVTEKMSAYPKLSAMFSNCFANTLNTTIKRMPDGTTFVITGDIPAMWLRDSAAQVRTYLILAEKDPDMAAMIEGVVRRQMESIIRDPYANAFNETANGHGHKGDKTEMSDWVWERKYEIDSLCYPIQLAYLLWKASGRTSQFDGSFKEAAVKILDLWETEQDHVSNSPYSFQRSNCPESDTLPNDGKGNPVAVTGMTWSGFRPSDDACRYGYLVPANMFAVVALGYLAEIATAVLSDSKLAEKAKALAARIDEGIKAHCIVEHGEFGPIYAYEVDGFGNHNLMDDANVPSLLSIPYLGYCAPEDPIYVNTRKFVLSKENPYFYSGKAAEGVGSPHTPKRYIWHIALAIQGLTATDKDEKLRLLKLMSETDAGKGLMHEGFDVDDPNRFTRPWFSWANMMFCELVLDYCGIKVPGSPLK